MIVTFENFNHAKARVNLLFADARVNIAHCRYQRPSEDEFFMPQAAVTYVHQGKKVVYLNGERHEMVKGDALYIPKNSIIYSDILVRKGDFISINMTLRAGEAVSPLASLARRLNEPASLQQLAAAQCMSVSTFQRWFRKTTGHSAGQWLLAKRLEHARYLLQQREATVTGAGAESGFEDTSYFIRRYRQRFGVTPARDAKN